MFFGSQIEVFAESNDVINKFDLFSTWLSETSLSAKFNSFQLQSGEGKRHSLEGKKDIYPVITPRLEGKQEISFGKLNLKLDNCNMLHSFVTGGEQAYEIGTLSGAFLKRGVLWGDEAGVWSQPFKMLDGILVEISVDGSTYSRLNDSRHFINKLFCVEFHYQTDEIHVIRRDWSPDQFPAFCYQLEMDNKSKNRKSIKLRVTLQSNIRPIWQKDWFVEYGKDIVNKINKTTYSIRDEKIDSIELILGTTSKVNTNSYADTQNPFRNRIVFEYDFSLKSNKSNIINLTVLMHDQKKQNIKDDEPSKASAKDRLNYIQTNINDIRKEKENLYKSKILDNVQFYCPDKTLQDAYYLGLFNLQTLTSDTRPYLKYKHIMTSPERAYQLLFGIDPMYTSMGAMCTGFQDIVKETIKNHLHYAAEINNIGINYIVDHWGRHPTTGARAQETTQFIGTVWEFLKTTGNKNFALSIYPQIKELMQKVQNLDTDKDGWLEGMTFPRISKETNSEKELSAAVRLIWAMNAMSEYAQLTGDIEYSIACNSNAEELRKRFNKEWWRDDVKCWTIGLYKDEYGENTFIEDTIYNQGSVNYPQKYKIADNIKGKEAINSTWRNAVDSLYGYHGPAVTTWQSSNFALGCYNYGESDKGYKLLMRAAQNPTKLEKMLGAFSTINSHPEKPTSNANKIMYNWSVGPFLEVIMYGLMGIVPNAFDKIIEFNPQIPSHWKHCSVINYSLGNMQVDFIFDNGIWKITNKSRTDTLNLYIKSLNTNIKIESNKTNTIRL